jgi:signal transduction histidine kinase
MLSRYQPDDPAYQDLDQIESTAQRAASLTRQLLAFSRNQASARQPVDLNATVTSVTDMLARLIGENIDLAVTLDPKLDLVMADPGQIEQVIVNFAVNARDAMPNGGRLTITTGNVMLNAAFVAAHPAAAVGPHVVLEVCDNGVGMDDPTLQRVFEPFFTTKAAGKGCGLGLSTVYGIVKGHDGYTGVESEPGRELAERMRMTRPDTRILFMSGYAEPPIPDDVLLQKPVTPDALARKVSEVLHQPALAD